MLDVREKTMVKMPSMATGKMRAQRKPSVACLYCARRSRSARVKMMSLLAQTLPRELRTPA